MESVSRVGVLLKPGMMADSFLYTIINNATVLLVTMFSEQDKWEHWSVKVWG